MRRYVRVFAFPLIPRLYLRILLPADGVDARRHELVEVPQERDGEWKEDAILYVCVRMECAGQRLTPLL